MIKTDTMTPQFFQDKLDPGAFLSNQGTFSVGAAELVRRERQEVGFGPPTLTPRVGLLYYGAVCDIGIHATI